ncbi:MerR family transcriptional regulator [Nocardia pseudobrasiliensis]|uniref:DNA-binding transcriptional MerR regulator n=1 Tax=Nocardia pseudobrasiliensis TaxID=45979 RepID=A0A370I258_9NOCA|nr:MerR family transcriptional regulator [Nocardia pseudobrasiliensis]RDI63364.1 DNA-binding transcriptional MerR regulator [Nocardia pseudobrasiliensis]
MGWSTRELAELAGTTLRTVRHYHEIGLLDQPERRANGYKSYGVTHLVRMLRIRRLTGLGLSLAQIAAMDDVDERPDEALRALDVELAQTIDRLQRTRDELGRILSGEASTRLPSELSSVAPDPAMSDAERSMYFVMSSLAGPQGLRACAEMLRNHWRVVEFDTLPADADEGRRARVAELMTGRAREMFAEHPDMAAWALDAPRGERFAADTLTEAVLDLYNPAQIDVLIRLGKAISG